MRFKSGISGGMKWMFLASVMIGMMGAFYMVFISGSVQVKKGGVITRGKLRAAGLYSKIITSEKCLSTGETGILDQDQLEAMNGSNYLDHAYLPSMKYFIEVKNLETGEKYTIGADFRDKVTPIVSKTFHVGIEKETEVDPGVISLSFMGRPNLLLSFTKTAEAARTGKESIMTVSTIGGGFGLLFSMMHPYPGMPLVVVMAEIGQKEDVIELNGHKVCHYPDGTGGKEICKYVKADLRSGELTIDKMSIWSLGGYTTTYKFSDQDDWVMVKECNEEGEDCTQIN